MVHAGENPTLDSNSTLALIPCEGQTQCTSLPDCRTGQAGVSPPQASCGDNHAGLLCASCVDGYEKVGGNCVECAAINLMTVAVTLLSATGIAYWMFTKALKVGYSPSQVRSAHLLSFFSQVSRLHELTPKCSSRQKRFSRTPTLTRQISWVYIRSRGCSQECTHFRDKKFLLFCAKSFRVDPHLIRSRGWLARTRTRTSPKFA